MSAVDLATVHHQGSGRPTDDPGEAGTKGYTLWIGPTRYTFLRPPSESFATIRFNHVSFDVCFSGDRDVWPITAHDLALLRSAAGSARALGWLDPAPYVRPHRESPGSYTICPGNNTAYPDPARGFPNGNPLVWLSIVTALHEEAPPVAPKVAPEFFPALEIVSVCTFQASAAALAVAMVDATGAVFCEPASAYKGGANGRPYFAGRTAARIDARKAPGGFGYVITDTAGESYNFPE